MGIEKLLSNVLHASPWWVRLIVSRVFLWPTIIVKRLAWALGWDIAGQCCPWNRVHDHVVLGAAPLVWDVATLFAPPYSVRAVVNTQDEYGGPRATYAKYGIAQLRVRTIDFTIPDYAQCVRSVLFMANFVRRGEDVLVHCKAGKGRSTTVVLCFLIAAYGMTPEEAEAQCRLTRPFISSRKDKPVVKRFAAEAPRLWRGLLEEGFEWRGGGVEGGGDEGEGVELLEKRT